MLTKRENVSLNPPKNCLYTDCVIHQWPVCVKNTQMSMSDELHEVEIIIFKHNGKMVKHNGIMVTAVCFCFFTNYPQIILLRSYLDYNIFECDHNLV